MIVEQIKYRATGIHWTPEIPENWEQMRLKNICDDRLQYGINVPSSKYSDDGIRFLRTTDIDEDGNIIDEGIYIPKDEVEQSYLLQQGDLLFSRSGTVGRCYIHNTDNVYSYAGFLVRFRPVNKLLSKWMFYYSFTKEFKYQVNSEALVSTISNFNGNKYATLKLFFPKDNNELINILNYLDKKTKQVENFIEKKKQFIGYLKEQRQSIINDAVSKGIDDNIKLKVSGIDWLPEISNNFSVSRLRFLCKITTGGKNTEDRIDDGLYPFFVRSQTIEKINTYSYDGEAILTAGDGVGVGKVFHYINEKFDFHQRVYMFYDFIEGIDGEYLYNFIQNNFMKEVMLYNAKSTVDSLRLPMIKNFPVAFPSFEEQKRIVKYIKEETATIDKAIAKTELEIELIKEYKEALISEAVIGKKIA
jgi:type I restriction enzyme S subunit